MRYEMTFGSDAACRRIEKIQQILRARDLSLQEIADEINMTLRWARAYVVYLHQRKQLHIASWELRVVNDYFRFTPHYCWGNATDAIKPATLTFEQRKETRKTIKKVATLEDEIEIARRRALEFKPQRDWAASWIPTRAVA